MSFRAFLWYCLKKPSMENWINKYKYLGDILVAKKKIALKVFHFIKKSNLAFIQVVKRHYLIKKKWRAAKARKIGLFLAI